MASNNFLHTLKRQIARSAKRVARFVQYWGEDADFDMEALVNKYRGQGMRVGANAYFVNSYFDPFHPELITIGNNVTVTNSVVLTHDDSSIVFTNRRRVGPVHIGDNVFIGYRSLILPGVAIGSNCIIGAGSVVTRDIPDNSIAVGVPAKVVKAMFDHLQHLEADPFLLGIRVNSIRITNDEHEEMRLEVLKKYRPDLLIPPKHVEG